MLFLKKNYLFIWLCWVSAAARGIFPCGTQAKLPFSMWDLSSLTWDRAQVPCLGRQILKHWTARGTQHSSFLSLFQQPVGFSRRITDYREELPFRPETVRNAGDLSLERSCL